MNHAHNLLMTMINALLALALAALLISPMVFFYAALAAAPTMLVVLVLITLTTRAKAPQSAKAPHSRAQGTSL